MLERELGVEVEVRPGSFGQFDVRVAGRVVASKTGPGVLSRLLGRGEFPDEDAVVAAVRERLGAGGAARPPAQGAAPR